MQNLDSAIKHGYQTHTLKIEPSIEPSLEPSLLDFWSKQSDHINIHSQINTPFDREEVKTNLAEFNLSKISQWSWARGRTPQSSSKQ